MPKQIPYLNEIIGLVVMFLMLAALVAGQVDATSDVVDRARYETGLIRVDDDTRIRP